MTYTTTQLAEPVRLKRGRGRPCTLATAVLRDEVVVAVFKIESAATAYAWRLNQLSEKRHA